MREINNIISGLKCGKYDKWSYEAVIDEYLKLSACIAYKITDFYKDEIDNILKDHPKECHKELRTKIEDVLIAEYIPKYKVTEYKPYKDLFDVNIVDGGINIQLIKKNITYEFNEYEEI